MKYVSALFILVLTTSVLSEDGKQSNPHLAPLMTTFDLDFGGGTIAQLLSEVEAQSGKQPNIIADQAVVEMTVPAMSLRGVSTWSLLKGLEQILMDTGDCQLAIRVSTGNPAQQDAIVTLSCIPGKSEPDDLRPVIFVIPDLLEEYELDDIHTAIRTALDMALGEDAKPAIKFHFETKLLMVKCDRREEMEIVQTVLHELRQSLKRSKTK